MVINQQLAHTHTEEKESIPVDSYLSLFSVLPPCMQDSHSRYISCHWPTPYPSPREAVLPHAGHSHQPLFHRLLHKVYILWLLSLPPSCCCFLRQFLKGGSIPEDGQHIPRSPRELMWLQGWQAVMSWEYRHNPCVQGHTGSCGAWIFFLCLIFFCIIYRAVTRVEMSCHAMLNSLLLPQVLISQAYFQHWDNSAFCLDLLWAAGPPKYECLHFALSFSFSHSQQAQLESLHNRSSLWQSSICEFLVWPPHSFLCIFALSSLSCWQDWTLWHSDCRLWSTIFLASLFSSTLSDQVAVTISLCPCGRWPSYLCPQHYQALPVSVSAAESPSGPDPAASNPHHCRTCNRPFALTWNIRSY